jgi:hypothetical protein
MVRPAMLGMALLLSACGGGGGGGSSSSGGTPPPPGPPPPPPIPVDTQYRASAASPFTANCEGTPQSGTVYINAEVEPYLAFNPLNTNNLVGIWQQDRWSNGGSRGLMTGTSIDGGHTWSQRAMPFSRCGGGNAGNNGDYDRASDPWVTFAPDGTAHEISISFDDGNTTSAVLASRSTDGGATWSTPLPLILDGASFFNDKESITADPTDAHFVYAVWDRLALSGFGPTFFARSSNGGVSWEPAHAIFTPTGNNQTIGNMIVVLPNGTLVNMMTEIDTVGGAMSSFVEVIRSTDKGLTWSAPIRIASELPIGTHDPETGSRVRDGSLLPAIAVGATGNLFVVWQDGRFNGVRDGIALSRSTDGGFTWSAPTQINGNPAVQAFEPTVRVRADGTIGITYYDFNNNTSDSSTLLTDYWLARSSDGINFQENIVSGPFNLNIAPLTTSDGGGYFVGDYQGLIAIGNLFVPFYVVTNNDFNNRTDVFAAPAVSFTAMAMKLVAQRLDVFSPPKFNPTEGKITPQLLQRVQDNIVRTMRARIPSWHSAMPSQSSSLQSMRVP